MGTKILGADSRRLSGHPVTVEYTQPMASMPNSTSEDEAPWKWELLSDGPVTVEHMQSMIPLTPSAEDETILWEPPRRLKIAPPGFIYNYAGDSGIRRAFKEKNGNNQPRLDSFGPIPFLSEHASFLDVSYVVDVLEDPNITRSEWVYVEQIVPRRRQRPTPQLPQRVPPVLQAPHRRQQQRVLRPSTMVYKAFMSTTAT
ncbi:hypothetical protein H4582DRAFT_2099728 [Lactarius indigo]|nr:hypothetical protein H4582DRAFT_2099728 [Lactarius indigo]